VSRNPNLFLALVLGALLSAGGVAAQQARHGGGFRAGRAFERGGYGARGAAYGRGPYPTPYARGFPGGYPPLPIYAPPPAPAYGPAGRGQQEEARFGVRHGRFAPLGAVIAGIRRQAPGRQLDTAIEDLDGRAVYRVRWITVRGRRMDFIVDAATGAILSER
jgi:hypothetical protein